MPKMNGLELIDRIDAELNLKAKIVVCSGLHSIGAEVKKRGRNFSLKTFSKK